MELKQLEYFLAVCEELHFTRAAEKLGISQPSLSQQIRALEYEMGTPLFDRIGKKTSITKAGQILKKHSQNIFLEIEMCRTAFSELNGLQRGKLEIGALLTVVNYLLPTAVLEFHAHYPKVELSVLGMRTGDIREATLQNKLDLGILALPADDHEDLHFVPLYTEELALAVPAQHELAGSSIVSLGVLETVPSILLPDNFYLRKIIDQSCSQLGFSPKPILEMSTMESIINMVKKDAGVTVLPKPYLEFLNLPEIHVVSLADPTPTRQIGVIYRKDKHICAATRTFIDKLTDMAELMENTRVQRPAKT